MGGSSTTTSGDGSLFRVGDSIGLSYVLLFLSVLVIFVVVLEQLLHKLEHHARKSRKHEEMLRKVYRELMILGFIGVIIKIFKEVTHISAYSDSIVAFQVADLTVFIVAVALIIQALCVFLALRHKNFELDRVELVRTGDLVQALEERQRSQHASSIGWLAWLTPRKALACGLGVQTSTISSTDKDLDDLVQLRFLRHLFLRRYGLPELFPFSKYVRQAQDNQITHMIDVEISMWLILLGAAWAIDGAVVLFRQIGGHPSEPHALVLALSVFSWTLLAVHLAVMLYFRRCVKRLLNAGGSSQRKDAAVCLVAIAQDEDAVLTTESATDALEGMQEVQERQEARYRVDKSKRRANRHHLVARDTGFQLVAMAARQVFGWCGVKKGGKPTASDPESNGFSTTSSSGNSSDLSTINMVGDQELAQRQLHRRRSAVLSVDIRWFSRKVWHFIIMVLMMLNAFYLAEFCQCVLYQVGSFSSQPLHIRILIVVGLPLPIVLNMAVVQPRILRHFLIVSSILRVDVSTLSDVVTHFSEIVELRAEFVETLLGCLEQSGASVAQLELALRAKDRSRSGVLRLEQLRLVLCGFGFRLSHFRFNSVAKLLFRLRDSTVEYAQVLRMLALVEQHVEVAAVEDPSMGTTVAAGHHGYHPHGHLLLRQSVLIEEEEATVSPEEAEDAFAHVEAINGTTVAARAGDPASGLATTAPRRHLLTRRQSSFQNTSARTLRALYHLDTYTGDDSGADHSARLIHEESSSPRATHYVRM